MFLVLLKFGIGFERIFEVSLGGDCVRFEKLVGCSAFERFFGWDYRGMYECVQNLRLRVVQYDSQT